MTAIVTKFTAALNADLLTAGRTLCYIFYVFLHFEGTVEEVTGES